MTDNHQPEIDLADIAERESECLAEALPKTGICRVLVPWDIHLRNHSDVALQYLELAFIGEQLTRRCGPGNVQAPCPDSAGRRAFVVRYSDGEVLSAELARLACLYSDLAEPECGSAPGDFAEFVDDVHDYRFPLAFPGLADSYFANFIGSHYDWDDEYKRDVLHEHPEWSLHTWRSPWSLRIGFELYVSPAHWILAREAPLGQALLAASDLTDTDLTLLPASRVFSDLHHITLITPGEVVTFSMSSHAEAVRAAAMVLPVDPDPFENARYRWLEDHSFELAANRSFLRCLGHTFQYVLFRDSFSVLDRLAISKLSGCCQDVVGQLFDLSGEALQHKCDWSLIDEESFEQLCYDLVRRDGRFSIGHTKKMGSARSRDGGRDIVTQAVARAGGTAELEGPWIVQCKFTRSGRSLGRDAVRVTELIDEYAPGGVIVATNGPVDAGTHDKYQSISRNRDVPIEAWDGLRIERDLNRNPDLFRTYFRSGSGTPG